MNVKTFSNLVYCIIIAFLLTTFTVCGVFSYYIYKSFQGDSVSISAVQDGTHNNQEVNNV